MIIQCEKCLTKFKLDDSKVTPQGVKVKCKKCANIFTVFPEKPKEEEFKFEFPQEPSFTEPAKEAQPSVKSEEKPGFELPSFEMSFEKKEEEKKAEEFTLKKEEAEKEEFSWDQFNIDLGEKKDEMSAGEISKEEEKTTVSEFDFGSFEDIKAQKEEPVVSDKEEVKENIELDFDFQKFSQEVVTSEKESESKEEGLSKTLEEFVFEEPEAKEETKEETKEAFNFEFELPKETKEAEAKSVELKEEQEGKIGETSETLEVFPSSFESKLSDETILQESQSVDKETTFEAFSEEATFESKEDIEQLTDKPASEEFEFITSEIPEEKSFEFGPEKEEKVRGEEAVQPPLDFEAIKPERNWLSYIVAVLIVVILSGTGIGLIWWQKTKLLETEGNFGLTAVKTDFFESKTLEKVFVVKGNVVNGYRVPKSFIKVKATIKSKDNKVLVTKLVFAGNVFSQSEIKELTYPEIEKGLNNKMGKSMMNVDIPPGKSLPFMVVFDKVPPEAANIEVESL